MRSASSEFTKAAFKLIGISLTMFCAMVVLFFLIVSFGFMPKGALLLDMLIVGQGLSIIYIPLLIVGIYLSIKYREGKILEVLSKRDVCISFAVNSKRGMPFNLMQIVAVVTLIFLMLFSICMKEGAHLSRCWLI